MEYNKEKGVFEVGFPTEYQAFIHKSRYARWLPDESRRETWEETVDRYCKFFFERMGNEKDNSEVTEELRKAILELEVMPSMRCLMTAGAALDKDNVAGYNCAFIAVDNIRVFDEILYVLMCGTGVGFSVERQFINKLPEVSEDFYPSDTVIDVADSKIGWAKAFKQLLSLLWQGEVPQWDLSKLRPAGAPLKTFGGRSSGPEPLDDLFRFSVDLLRKARGRRLTSIECHDLVCKVADIVVVGGVRRSALISLSNVSDDRMRHAKTGQWWIDNPQRALANNSACYNEKPDFEVFFNEWKALYESKCGERGIFSRYGAKKIVERNGRRDPNYEWGCNPCSEILLRPSGQFCNLTEIVVRYTDTLEDLIRKARQAAILGTLQATLTDFRYLRSVWKRNTEEEALLGVSMTGIMDHPLLAGVVEKMPKSWWGGVEVVKGDQLEGVLDILRQVVIDTNKEWAEKLGINQAAATTCVKPSGTVSQLVDSASGIHPRYSQNYIRRVRVDIKDPICQFMLDSGFEYEKDVISPSNVVFSFPIQAPDTGIDRNTFGAIEQLELWLKYQKYWCEHKPSITVYYKDDEFFDVGSWVWNNFDYVSGVSFLPHSDHTYQQAPYEEITKEQFNELVEVMPTEIDWSALGQYEIEDNTVGSQTYACTGSVCEIVDVVAK